MNQKNQLRTYLEQKAREGSLATYRDVFSFLHSIGDVNFSPAQPNERRLELLGKLLIGIHNSPQTSINLGSLIVWSGMWLAPDSIHILSVKQRNELGRSLLRRSSLWEDTVLSGTKPSLDLWGVLLSASSAPGLSKRVQELCDRAPGLTYFVTRDPTHAATNLPSLSLLAYWDFCRMSAWHEYGAISDAQYMSFCKTGNATVTNFEPARNSIIETARPVVRDYKEAKETTPDVLLTHPHPCLSPELRSTSRRDKFSHWLKYPNSSGSYEKRCWLSRELAKADADRHNRNEYQCGEKQCAHFHTEGTKPLP